MKLTGKIVIVLMSVMVFLGCNRQRRLWPYGWVALDPAIDSATVALERAWIEWADADTLNEAVERLSRLCDLSGDKRADVRALYWQGRLAMRMGLEERGDSLYQLALQLNDSATNPYDTHRLLWATEDDPLPHSVDTYDYLKGQTEFFESAGDMMLAGATSMDLGMFLSELGQSVEAVRWLDRADSLYHLAGLDHIVEANRLNRSHVLAIAGDTIGAVKILYEMRDDPVIQADAQARDLVLNDLFICAHDTAALFEAYEGVRDDPDMVDAATLYEGCIAGVFVARNMVDSAWVYARRAMDKYDLLWNTRSRIDVLAWAAESAMAVGEVAQANEWLARRLEQTEELLEETRRGEVLNHQLAEHRLALEYEADRRTLNTRIFAIGIVVTLIVVILIIIVLFMRRQHRHRIAVIEQQLRYEKMSRRLMTTRLALEQKQALLGDIERNVAGSDDPTSHLVDSAIRAHKATAEGDETLVEAYANINPQFVPRLLTQYPSLTPADCRMLTLIALGMPTKQIASTLGIRIESVKQSRRRLRIKMQLPQGASLEQVIAAILRDA